ncbi:MAG TPA: SHOCT domain-containing protein [Gaiellaceae bacterium]
MHGPPGGPDPLAVARMRYARGEIGRDEYVQLAQDLGEAPAAEPPTPPA